jgi:hypothetical protein
MAMENLTVAVGSSSDSIEKDAVLHSLVEPERIRGPSSDAKLRIKVVSEP